MDPHLSDSSPESREDGGHKNPFRDSLSRPFSLPCDMPEGRRKTVGFTPDTAPPSPEAGPSLAPSALGRQYPDPSPGLLDEPDGFPFPAPLDGVPDLGEDDRQGIFEAMGGLFEYEPRREAEREDYIVDEAVEAKATEPKPAEPNLDAKPAKAALRKSRQPTDIELRELLGISPDPAADEQENDAHSRAQRLAAKVGSYSASTAVSRNNSIDLDSEAGGSQRPLNGLGRKSSIDSDDEVLYQKRALNRVDTLLHAHLAAEKLVRSYTKRDAPLASEVGESPLASGQVTPVADRRHVEDYVPRPQQFRGGVLGSLMKLSYGGQQGSGAQSPVSAGMRGHARNRSVDDVSLGGTTPLYSPAISPSNSGTTTPTGKRLSRFRSSWSHGRNGSSSPGSVAALVTSSNNFVLHKDAADEGRKAFKQRPGMGKRTRSSEAITNFVKKMHPSRAQEEMRITKHIAETIARHRYIVKLCKALMDYGAPTHRLEEYLKMSSRVLEIEAQFLYLPGCMLISFDDTSTHTTEVKLVRTPQGVDLGKLRDTHLIYKDVVHDHIDVIDATSRLEKVMVRGDKFNVWFRIFMYGIAAASVGPFAFSARFIDLPIAFGLGCILGVLQLKIATRSDLYANVFEVFAALLTSFLARAFGSIINPATGKRYFCFSALAQSSIALILPGYTVLCASLELQSRSIVAGSVRMVYAIIYSLFLGYGITIGSLFYGWADKNASSETTCESEMNGFWFFFFVPIFTLSLIVINQAKWKQAPAMTIIAFAGFVVSYFTSLRFRGNTQVSSSLGALTIGVMANLYARLGPKTENYIMHFWIKRVQPILSDRSSRIRASAQSAIRKLSAAEEGDASTDALDDEEKKKGRKPMSKAWRDRKGYGMAAAAMLPAIMVQVPSGLAVSGSLVAGVTSADQIISNSTGTSTASSGTDTASISNAAFTVSLSVVQIAIGITVGLFFSAVLVYPLGKRRSGLFSF